MVAAGSFVALFAVVGFGIGIYGANHPASEAGASQNARPATPKHTAPTSTSSSSSASGSALDVLATLPVKGKSPSTGYARTTDFGAAWLDVDQNGCDTRNDILARDLSDVAKQGTCTVLSGTLADPYTGDVIAFARGGQSSSLVQIDHIVPLENAWVTGAQKLTKEQRERLANDPLNLIAVDAHSNEQKSSGDAATWLPARTSFRCEYVARQISVKAAYGLWVTQAEHDAMVRVLAGCSSQMAESSPFAPADSVTTPPSTPPTEAPTSDVYFANCAAVRAAGKAPLHAGEPGYSRKLDRDGDGIACE